MNLTGEAIANSNGKGVSDVVGEMLGVPAKGLVDNAKGNAVGGWGQVGLAVGGTS